MRKYICILLFACLLLTACGQSTVTPKVDENSSGGNFSPETTAVASGLTQAVAAQEATEDAGQPLASDAALPADQAVSDQPLSEGKSASPVDEAVEQQTQTEAAVSSAPTPSATPKVNSVISGYSQISNTGLGFQYSYPVNWTNIPGYNTVCFVQPSTEEIPYPARVSVTMKKLAHKCSDSKAKDQLISFLKTLMTQYDDKTFEVDGPDVSTKFMGQKAIAATYLAYDGTQEIKGYTILTYYERYVFCFHFVCAYENYPEFEDAMRYMRDSVQAEALS